jgi:hypothetical protein
MKRRDFITVLCGTVAWPLVARKITKNGEWDFASRGTLAFVYSN